MMAFGSAPLRSPDSDIGGSTSMKECPVIHSHRESLSQIAEMAFANLIRTVKFDTQSDETSPSIPSTQGQVELAKEIKRFFEGLGLSVEFDRNQNVLVTIPSNITEGPIPPPTALMVHMDTSKGTVATDKLIEVPNWDGSSVEYPEVPALIVNAEKYPHISGLKGQTLIHGGGKAPFGLDNKAGMCEIMTLAELLISNPDIKHGEIILGFRADEEIGRHAAVESLAEILAERGVTYAWTVDGATPFEINTSNFNAARADVVLKAEPLKLPDKNIHLELTIEITGVDTHGATAKEEGYLNAAIVFARFASKLNSADSVSPVDFDRTTGKETTGILKVVVSGNDLGDIDTAKTRLLSGIEDEIRAHRWKGADFAVVSERAVDAEAETFDDTAIKVAEHLNGLIHLSRISPILSEESSGFEGYTNPHWVSRVDGGIVVRYRLRDFSPELLAARGDELTRICKQIGQGEVTVTQQYVDMGPSLKHMRQLTEFPRLAFEPLRHLTSFEVAEFPVRGGTGVDSFTKLGVFVGNVGPGYYFLESGKELTTRELLALHTSWLFNLVQVAAQPIEKTEKKAHS